MQLKIKNTNQPEVNGLDVDKKLRSKRSYSENIDVVIPRVIAQHVDCLCKKICRDNCYKYKCTLDLSWGKPPGNASLCEWGNATYDWMQAELLHITNLNESNNRKIFFLERYFRKIVTSVQFWERYKNWRFGRRLRVPDYIKALDRHACRIFWSLYDQDSMEIIAQKINLPESEVGVLVGKIYSELHARKRLYILEKEIVYSLDSESLDSDSDIQAFLSVHIAEEELESHENIMAAYKQLSWQEQYILDVMVVDNLSAGAVLMTLKEQSIALDDRTAPQDLDVQKIYYFLRKTISKLEKKSKVSGARFNDNA